MGKRITIDEQCLLYWYRQTRCHFPTLIIFNILSLDIWEWNIILFSPEWIPRFALLQTLNRGWIFWWIVLKLLPWIYLSIAFLVGDPLFSSAIESVFPNLTKSYKVERERKDSSPRRFNSSISSFIKRSKVRLAVSELFNYEDILFCYYFCDLKCLQHSSYTPMLSLPRSSCVPDRS